MRFSRIVLACCLALAGLVSSCATLRSSDLVEVKTVIPDIVLDIRYATTNNFTGKILYPSARCFLRRNCVERLAKAQKEFKALGYGLKIYDGYRPLSVQRRMWEVYPNEGYVANPAKGSKHNRGAAVDVTMVKPDGSEVSMTSPYDDFTEKAHRDYAGGTPEERKHRQILEDILTKNGFIGLKTEWWHFDDQNWRQYPIMDEVPK